MHLPKLMLLISGFFLFHLQGATEVEAQTNDTDKRYIEVTGSAEMLVVPDEIYLNITLVEFMKDNKTKVSIKDLEAQLYKTLKKAGLPTDALKVSTMSANLQLYKKRKDKEVFARKTYQLHTSELDKMDPFLDELSNTDITNLYVEKLDNTNMKDYRLQVKLDAVKAAKVKATALLGSIDEKLGQVLTIIEIDDQYRPVYKNTVYNTRSLEMDSAIEPLPQEFEPIKLEYKVQVRFEIQ